MINISLVGKKALVGGSSQGLGKAIAIVLAQSGATVTLLARNEEKLNIVLQELPSSYQQKHNILIVDYSNLKAYCQVIDTYFTHNTVDILINNTNGPNAGTVSEKQLNDSVRGWRPRQPLHQC